MVAYNLRLMFPNVDIDVAVQKYLSIIRCEYPIAIFNFRLVKKACLPKIWKLR